MPTRRVSAAGGDEASAAAAQGLCLSLTLTAGPLKGLQRVLSPSCAPASVGRTKGNTLTIRDQEVRAACGRSGVGGCRVQRRENGCQGVGSQAASVRAEDLRAAVPPGLF